MAFLSRVLHHHSDKSSRSSRASSASNLSGRGGSKKSSLISLKVNLESPPVVLYGQAHESTGSLISGVLTLEVHPRNTPVLSPQVSNGGTGSRNGLGPVVSNSNSGSNLYATTSAGDASGLSPVVSNTPSVDVDSVFISLVQTVHYTKPFIPASSSISGCKACTVRKTTLAEWDVLSQSAAFPVGVHEYPFSHLLPGSLAASSKLGSVHSYSYIKYDLLAVAKVGTQETTVKLPINVSRSILRGPDRNSLRVFPPTEVTASAVLPGVMYPKSTFPIELKMGHVVSSKSDRRWRMRKLSWKLEEHTQVAAHACEEHAGKIKAMQDSQRDMQLAKKLRQGNKGSGHDGASKSSDMHHSTIQTSMFVGRPPVNPSGAIRAAAASNIPHAEIPATPADVPVGNHDLVEEEEEVPTNRVIDEVLHFEEDFGSGTPGTPANAETDAEQPQNNANMPNPDNIPAGFTPLESAMTAHPGTPTAAAHEDGSDAEEALFLDEVRVVAHGDIKSGWKSDFTGDGSIELVAEICALDCSSGIKKHVMKGSSEEASIDDLQDGLRNDANVSCDISDPVLGIYVGHVLVLEVIVAEEVVSQSRSSQVPKEGLTPVASASSVSSVSNVHSVGVPTGAARVLRMQFKVVLTERSGLGIAWDDEVPPMYEAVRALSPPTYDTPTALQGLSPSLSGSRMTPSILYGLGDTPLVGSFMQNRNMNSIDAMADLDEHVQEFRL